MYLIFFFNTQPLHKKVIEDKLSVVSRVGEVVVLETTFINEIGPWTFGGGGVTKRGT